jgi:hypothetical protein
MAILKRVPFGAALKLQMRLAGVCSLPGNLSPGVINSYRDLDNISGMKFEIFVNGQTFAVATEPC